MSKFWEYLQSSALIQGVLTVGVTAVASYLIIVGQEVPTILEGLVTLSWGFFFGGKLGIAQAKAGK